MLHALQMRPRAPVKLSSPAATRSRLSSHALIVRAAKVADGPKIAIVGVTGAVGQEFLRVRVFLYRCGCPHSAIPKRRLGLGSASQHNLSSNALNHAIS